MSEDRTAGPIIIRYKGPKRVILTERFWREFQSERENSIISKNDIEHVMVPQSLELLSPPPPPLPLPPLPQPILLLKLLIE